MCKPNDTLLVRVPIQGTISHTGYQRWADKPVDRCIARLGQSLNAGGVYTVASCCGHGKRPGSIVLLDGRTLAVETVGVVSPRMTLEEMEKRAILATMSRVGKNMTRACRELQIGRTTMYRKLHAYGWQRPPKRTDNDD